MRAIIPETARQQSETIENDSGIFRRTIALTPRYPRSGDIRRVGLIIGTANV